MIIAGGAVGTFLTSDTSAKQLPSDIANYLHMMIKKESADLLKEESDTKDDVKDTKAPAKAVAISQEKSSLLDKAKKMTKEELIEFIKSATTLLK